MPVPRSFQEPGQGWGETQTPAFAPPGEPGARLPSPDPWRAPGMPLQALPTQVRLLVLSPTWAKSHLEEERCWESRRAGSARKRSSKTKTSDPAAIASSQHEGPTQLHCALLPLSCKAKGIATMVCEGAPCLTASCLPSSSLLASLPTSSSKIKCPHPALGNTGGHWGKGDTARGRCH